MEQSFPSKLPIGRLAPSPTGAQHLGNARTFLTAWLSNRKQSGQLVLRMEDLDTPRTKAGADRQAIEDLQWLGLDWDVAPGSERDGPRLIQSQRLDRYQELFQRLASSEHIYPCTCSRSDIEQAQSAPHERTIGSSHGPNASDGEVRYPGTCSHRSAADARSLRAGGQSFCWRFRTPSQPMEWVDGFWGQQQANPQELWGDFVIARANGAPAYQLAVVVDDHDGGITEVVRGDDLIPSTYRQILIYQAFAWQTPRFIHLPLVVGPDGRRLAKRHGDTRLSMLREHGIEPEVVVGYLAFGSGWLPSFRPIGPRELLESFDLHRLPKEPFLFDPPNAVDFFRSLSIEAKNRGMKR